jgi:hypothetical protein
MNCSKIDVKGYLDHSIEITGTEMVEVRGEETSM